MPSTSTFVAITLSLLVALAVSLDLAADYLWFAALGYSGVFWLIIGLKLGCFAATLLVAFVYFWVNVRRLAATVDLNAVGGGLAQQFARSAGQGGASPASVLIAGQQTPAAAALRWLTLAALFVALIFAFSMAARWDTLLRYWWAKPYGGVDPIYGRDIGFYLFELPLFTLLQNALASAAFLVTAGLIGVYVYSNAMGADWTHGVRWPPAVRRHVVPNLALYLAALAWGNYLDRYELLQSTRGVVYGAGFTDVHVVRPALWLAMALTGAAAAAVLYPPLFASGRRVLALLGGYLLTVLAGLALLPWLTQAFYVSPNELEAEGPYLRHNIALTRQAYGLDGIEARFHPVLDGLSPTAINRSRQTVDNIRLWDWRPLSETFRQLQQIRTYYTFGDVDVDRYWIDSRYRQVMLAVRELADELPENADTWVNRHLQYTHGYGVAMSLTAEKDPHGGPILVVKDLPPRSRAGLALDRPQVYYSETTPHYRVVTTAVAELDYPKGDENVYSRYRGSGGVLLDAFWKRLLFAWDQWDFNIAISAYVTPESRLQLWRNVRQRVQRVAPFLRLDQDPYPVIGGGNLYWIQDAYTTADGFPYAEPDGGGFNYIRNSVKAVVDAYQGHVTFYVMDTLDPVLAVYRQALPELFRPFAELPETLRGHLRYPQDLFQVQVGKYSRYHMTVPQVFYNGEDQWAAPWEKYGGEVIEMKPYYVLMKLPQEDRLQFLLMTPLTPYRRDNMIAWMAARCDFPAYGELLVYKLPKERLVVGPNQVEAMIDQDTLISQQLSLWDQRGSRVIRGNLLVIPIDNAFVYVEPVYLIAEVTNIPQLKRVIVSDGRRLAMEPTLEAALRAVFGTERPAAVLRENGQTAALAAARAALETAEQALRAGDWDGFGAAMQSLKGLLAR